MTSQIDPSKPTSDTPTVASVRANFQFAKDEIEALQNQAPTPSQIATAITTINQTLSNHEQRLSALEASAPPPPPPPPAPSIPGLTLTAEWQDPAPTAAGTSANLLVTAITDGTFSPGNIKLDVRADQGWYNGGPGPKTVNMSAYSGESSFFYMTLLNTSLANAIKGEASTTTPPIVIVQVTPTTP